MKTLRRLLPFLRPYRGRLLLILLLSSLLSVLSTATIAVVLPIMRVIFPDSTSLTEHVAPPAAGVFESIKVGFLSFVRDIVIVPADRFGSLWNLCLFLITLFAAKNIVKYSANLLNTYVEEGIIKTVRDRLFGSTINLSLDYFNARRSGELISVITNDVAAMNASVTPLLGTVIREPLQVLIMAVFLIALSPALTLVALSTSVLSILVVRVLSGYIKRYSVRLQTAFAEITTRLQETFQNIRLIKGYAAERYEEGRFRDLTSFLVRSSVKHSATVNLMGPFSEMFAVVAIGVVLFYGGSLVLDGEMRADELITFLFVLFAIMQPVVLMFTIPGTIQRGLVAAARVMDVLDQRPTVVGGTRTAPLSVNTLQFLNVGFSYRVGQPVLRDVTLTLKHGQTVALVGPSGGGKSTMMDLVVRLYDPTQGGIYVDGVDIREFDLASYRSLFGIVTQESILFNDSVACNISYGQAGLAQSVIEEAARMANAHDFIVRLPAGYDTPIGDRGVLLSGGQRQRLAIARALARDPRVLLFDEATSALDSESELLVQEAIERLLEDRTALIVAHRLSTIRRADLIAVLEEGAIVEQGRHEELLAAGGLYRRLYDVQFRDEE